MVPLPAPTCTSLVLLVGLQALLWAVLYSDSHSPLIWLTRWTVGRFRQAVTGNVRVMLSAGYEQEKLSPPSDATCMDYYCWIWIVAVHHAAAAAFAYAALANNSVPLFLFSLSFELGEDVLHVVQAGYTLSRPPGGGVKPFCDLPRGLCHLMLMHHSLGLTLGVAAFVHLAEWGEVHQLVFDLYFAALPSLFNLPLMISSRLHQRSAVAWLNALLNLFGAGAMAYCRLYKLGTLGPRIVVRMVAEFGIAAGCAASAPLAVFVLFCLLCQLFAVIDAAKAIREASLEPTAELRVEASLTALTRMSSSSDMHARRSPRGTLSQSRASLAAVKAAARFMVLANRAKRNAHRATRKFDQKKEQ